MTLVDTPPAARHVVVGATREEAAAAFGAEHDDAFVTTYADLAAEVDLDAARSLDLVPGHGFTDVLPRVSERLHAGADLAVRVAYPLSPAAGTVALADPLAQAGLRIVLVRESPGALLLVLTAAGEAQVADENARVLDTLAAATRFWTPTTPSTPSGAPAAPAAASRPTAKPAAGPRPRPPVPATVRVLDRLIAAVSGRRRRPAALAGLAAALLVLVVLVALGVGTGSATAVVLAVLVLVVLGATAVVTVLVMVLARQNHAEAYRLEEALLRNRTALRERTTQLGERLRAVEEAQARLPFAADYLEAMATANASAAARITDQLQQLADR